MIPKRIGIVTPVGPESQRLPNAIESVAAQRWPAAIHIVVYDGHEPAERDPRVRHVVLPFPCEDTGATPRAVGANLALAQHCDALAFLDADNMWSPEHLDSLAKLAERYDITVSTRRICDANGQFLYEGDMESDGAIFADTNCFLLTGRAVSIARHWGDVPRRPGIRTAGVDRVFWGRVKKQGFSIGCTGLATVCYRSRWLAHYTLFPERKPPRCKVLEIVDGIPTVKWV